MNAVGHDGFRIVGRRIQIPPDRIEDLLAHHRFRPAVWWTHKVSSHCIAVPVDFGEGLLVLVDEADGMAKFVQRDPPQFRGGGPPVERKRHGDFAAVPWQRRNSADVGPIALPLKGHADVAVLRGGGLHECE